MTRKCLLACNLSRISDPFIWTSDDEFILKPADARTLPLYQRDRWNSATSTRFMDSELGETYLECVRLGIPHLHYNTHVPLPIFKRKYIEAMQRIPWNTETETELVPQHLWELRWQTRIHRRCQGIGQVGHCRVIRSVPVDAEQRKRCALFGHRGGGGAHLAARLLFRIQLCDNCLRLQLGARNRFLS